MLVLAGTQEFARGDLQSSTGAQWCWHFLGRFRAGPEMHSPKNHQLLYGVAQCEFHAFLENLSRQKGNMKPYKKTRKGAGTAAYCRVHPPHQLHSPKLPPERWRKFGPMIILMWGASHPPQALSLHVRGAPPPPKVMGRDRTSVFWGWVALENPAPKVPQI